MDPRFYSPPDAAPELEALLEDSGVDYRREGGRFYFQLTSSGCRWQVTAQCEMARALFYFIHPAPIADVERALRACSEINGRLLRGGFFITGGHAVYRTGDELTDALEARERLCRAVEYASSVMVWFWNKFCP